jgi:hypothetical protein
MILIVLGTDHFVERYFLLTLVAPVTLNRVPWRLECTGIINVNLDFQSLAALTILKRSTTCSWFVCGVRKLST